MSEEELEPLIEKILVQEKIDDMSAVRTLYSCVYLPLADGEFEMVDCFISAFLKQKFSIQLCVGLLTITYQYRDRLSKEPRVRLLEYSHKQGLFEGFTEEQITKTLNGF